MYREPEQNEVVTVAIVDTETTGLEENDEPISVGIILLDARFPKGDIVQELGRYHGLRKPNVPISPGAQKVHKITIESLEGKEFDYTVVCAMLNSADYIIAHNAEFDCRMLQSVLVGIGRKSWLCSVNDIYWKSYSDARNRKLDTLCGYFGITRPKPHDAMTDAGALLQILSKRTGTTNRSRTLLGVLLSRNSTIYAPDDPIRELTDTDREAMRTARENYRIKLLQQAEEKESRRKEAAQEQHQRIESEVARITNDRNDIRASLVAHGNERENPSIDYRRPIQRTGINIKHEQASKSIQNKVALIVWCIIAVTIVTILVSVATRPL